jgi:hypothetical protein
LLVSQWGGLSIPSCGKLIRTFKCTLLANTAVTLNEVEAGAGLFAVYNNVLRQVGAAADTANTAADAASTE